MGEIIRTRCMDSEVESMKITYERLFPEHDFSNIKIIDASIVNLTMYYIAKFYNERIENLFDYNEIVSYPYQQEMGIRYRDYRLPRNEKKFDKSSLTQIYEYVDGIMEKIYQKLKDYIFKYIEDNKEDITIPSVKINAEMVAMSNGQFSNILEKKYMDDFTYCHKHGHNGECICTLFMYELDFPSFDNINNHPSYEYFMTIYPYGIKALSLIAEKLYFFTLAEVKKVIDGNNDSNLIEDVNVPRQLVQEMQPNEVVLPQQLIDFSDEYVQQVYMTKMQKPLYIANHSLERDSSCFPINIQPAQEIIPSIPYGIDVDNPSNVQAQNNMSTNGGTRVLSIEELQRRVDEQENKKKVINFSKGIDPESLAVIKKRIDPENQVAATDEKQSNLLEIEPDLMNSYNALDTYNKAMVGLFAQIILKHKNSIAQ